MHRELVFDTHLMGKLRKNGAYHAHFGQITVRARALDDTLNNKLENTWHT